MIDIPVDTQYRVRSLTPRMARLGVEPGDVITRVKGRFDCNEGVWFRIEGQSRWEYFSGDDILLCNLVVTS